MDESRAAAYWERNAETWTLLVRQGFDVYRDQVNTPAFLAALPDVSGLRGLDVGCGEGHNTRLLRERGARMTGLDVSTVFLRAASGAETSAARIRYLGGSATRLPFSPATFDFVTAFMSLMDLPDQQTAIAEAFRVLRPGGFLQFSITHPCFGTPHRRLLRDAEGMAYAVELGRYFDTKDGRIERWLFGAAPPAMKQGLAPFEIPVFHRTLSDWLNAISRAGFILEYTGEPYADDETARRFPNVQDTQVVSYFLHLRCRKPATA